MNTPTAPTPTGGWEVGQRAQYIARTPTSPSRFVVMTGPVERVAADGLTVRWDTGGAGRFAPDELHLLTREGTPAAHRAVFGPDATLPTDVLRTTTDGRGHTVADEVDVDGWTWNEADTETRMGELVDIAARLGVWGRYAVGLMIVPDYDEPAWAVVSLALLGRFRFAADAVELRELLGLDRVPAPRARRPAAPQPPAGRALAALVLARVTTAAAELTGRAACLNLPVLDPRPGRPRRAAATPAGGDPTGVGPAGETEGVRGDG